MEEENEVLDWGNEDDEQPHQDSPRKASFGAPGTGNDVDDAEDAVSLGEDEDEQAFYAYQLPLSTAPDEERGEGGALRRLSGNDDETELPRSTQDSNVEPTSTASKLDVSLQDSTFGTEKASSQPQPTPTRMMHALPPKPVVTSVPFLHPSHPSIVEATAMSSRIPRNSKNDSDPLPPGWEMRHSRSGARSAYYYNIYTQESTWRRPVGPSNHGLRNGARRRRPRSHSAGPRTSSPPRPNTSQTQDHTRSSRSHQEEPPNASIGSGRVTPPSGTSSSLTYEERHYRPGGHEEDSSSSHSRRTDRNLGDSDPYYAPRASTPPPRPPHIRERERSPSPVAHMADRGRDSRSSRAPLSSRPGHDTSTDANSSTQRDRIASSLPSSSIRGQWEQPIASIPNDSNSISEQAPRRRQRPRQYNADVDSSIDMSVYEERPPLARNGSSRGRTWDRETRVSEVRERNIRDQDTPTLRTGSPNTLQREPEPPHAPRLDHSQSDLTSVRTSTSDLPPTPPALQPRKRDRPSRFDQPLVSQPLTTPSAGAPLVSTMVSEPNVYQSQVEDDNHVPDDIASQWRGTDHRPDHRHDVERHPESLVQLPSARQAEPFTDQRALHPHEPMQQEDLQAAGHQDRSPPDVHHSRGRKRAPLPPQSASYREVQSKMPPPLDTQEHPPPSPPRHSPHVLSTSHDRPRLTIQNDIVSSSLPAGPRSQPRREERPYSPLYGRSEANRGQRSSERHLSDAMPMQLRSADLATETDFFNPSSAHRNSLRNAPSEEPINALPSRHGDRDINENPSTSIHSSHSQAILTPPTLPMGNRPAPAKFEERGHLVRNVGGRELDRFDRAASWKDDRYGLPLDKSRRDQRHRQEDYPRLTPSSQVRLSGTNNIPIGNRRSGPSNGSVAAPPGIGGHFVPNLLPPGISPANLEPLRNSKGRGSPPSKEVYERPPHTEKSYVDTYRPDEFEPQRRRGDGGPRYTPPAPRDSRERQDSHYPNRAQFSQQDLKSLPRIWTPRDQTPPPFPPVPSSSVPNPPEPVTPPPISREPSHTSWTSSDWGRPSRRSNDMDTLNKPTPRSENAGPRSQQPYESIDLLPKPEERTDAHEEAARPVHALPLNPTLHPDHNSYAHNRKYPPLHSSDSHPESRFRQEWSETSREAKRYDASQDHAIAVDSDLSTRSGWNPAGSKGSRIPPPTRRDERSYRDNHPHYNSHDSARGPDVAPRRGGSLLDRLSMDQDQPVGDFSSQSLRDRVQIPSKRDRLDMMDDYAMAESSYEVDDGSVDPASKKLRKRLGKPKRLRRVP